MRPEPLLSIVLPCRNQADHIQQILERYFEPLDRLAAAYELVVVPNANTDKTTEIVAGLAKREPRIRMVENPAGGWGRSVLCGLAACRGSVLSYTNSARTNPENFAPLWQLYRQHAPCLVKVKRVKRGAPLREVGSLLYNLEGRVLFGTGCGDVNGTPKIFPRQLYQELNLVSEGDLVDMELLAKVRRLGYGVYEHPVAGFKRHGGKSTTNFKSAWNMYRGAWQLRPLVAQLPKRKAA